MDLEVGPLRRYVRSVLAPAAVSALVQESYGLEVTHCQLLRSLVNDVYALQTTSGRYALKLYRQVHGLRARSADEVGWEQQLAVRLLDAGLSVPAPVALRDGWLVGQLDAPEGPRPFALTSWVPGTKPVPSSAGDAERAFALYEAFGSLTASFHTIASELDPGVRQVIEPLSELPSTAADVAAALTDESDQQLVLSRARWAGAQLSGLTERGLSWGIRHGDVTLDNLHVMPDTARDHHRDPAPDPAPEQATEASPPSRPTLALHDFDRSGPGWLAADLTGVRATATWPAFLAGYEQVRPLTGVDLDALPALQVVALIDNLQFHLVDKPEIFGSESRAEGWVARELASLRASVDRRDRPVNT